MIIIYCSGLEFCQTLTLDSVKQVWSDPVIQIDND